MCSVHQYSNSGTAHSFKSIQRNILGIIKTNTIPFHQTESGTSHTPKKRINPFPLTTFTALRCAMWVCRVVNAASSLIKIVPALLIKEALSSTRHLIHILWAERISANPSFTATQRDSEISNVSGGLARDTFEEGTRQLRLS